MYHSSSRPREADQVDAIVKFMADRTKYVGQFRAFVDAVRAATGVVIADRPYEMQRIASVLRESLALRGVGIDYDVNTIPTATYYLRRIEVRR